MGQKLQDSNELGTTTHSMIDKADMLTDKEEFQQMVYSKAHSLATYDWLIA